MRENQHLKEEKSTKELLDDLNGAILPTEKSVQKLEIFENTIHIFGPPGVGKSTFCAQDWMLIFDCEGGYGGLNVYRQPIPNWTTFLTYARAFLKEEHKFKACCIDRVEVLFGMCQYYISQKHEIEHPSDLEWGKGWSLLHDEFMRPLIALSVSKYGLFTISHESDKEIKTRASTYTRTAPSLAGSGPNSCYSIIVSIADLIIHMDYNEDGKRFLETKGNKNLVAKSRHKGIELEKIELPNEPEKSFETFEALWNKNVKHLPPQSRE